MLTWHCPTCDVRMSATDQKTLLWGQSTHRCVTSPTLGDLMLDETKGSLERDLICWLTGLYGRPFVLMRPGLQTVMVS
jgi:hypothetical protein